MSQSDNSNVDVNGYRIKEIVVDLTSDGSGDASEVIKGIAGHLTHVMVSPDAGGTQPTDAFDIVINNKESIDIMGGALADLSNAADAVHEPAKANSYGPVPFTREITVVASNMGASKGATVILYVI